MYTLMEDSMFNMKTIKTENMFIPLDPRNVEYQKVLDDIIEQGNDCWEGTVPAELQTAADAKQFAQQSEAYKIAKARIDQYQLSVGKPETTKTVIVGERWNDETMQTENVTETVTIPAIPPLDATVEIGTENNTTKTIENPLITKDNAERAAAQAIIDSTPQAVKDTF